MQIYFKQHLQIVVNSLHNWNVLNVKENKCNERDERKKHDRRKKKLALAVHSSELEIIVIGITHVFHEFINLSCQ